MRVPLTVPLKTGDGREWGECYVLVDVFVTQPPSPATWNSPADGPEWEVDNVLMELGSWKFRTDKNPVFVSEPVELPYYLKGVVTDYVHSRMGRDEIATQIQDTAREDW